MFAKSTTIQGLPFYKHLTEKQTELVLDSYGEGEIEELTEMFKTFEKGTSVKFKKSLKQ